MYEFNDLFNMRSSFAAKLEQYMELNNVTKAALSKGAGISRPTLDKILAADITNKVNFEKHVEKILSYLKITPDFLMGKSPNNYNKIRQILKALSFPAEKIALMTGISVDRLKEIESGSQASKAELRDIAMCCSTSVRGILGTNYFDAPIAHLAYSTQNDAFANMKGFWGHVGIMLKNNKIPHWFPISEDTRNLIYNIIENGYFIIPCMNNKLLLINSKGIDNVILLDEACDQPSYVEWDYNVSNGEIPSVFYEALEDYEAEFIYDFDDEDSNDMSDKLKASMESIIEKYNLTDDDIADILRGIHVYYQSGNQLDFQTDIQLDDNTVLTLQSIYEFEIFDDINKRMLFYKENESELFVNIENISMIELPLLLVENRICEMQEEFLNDIRSKD